MNLAIPSKERLFRKLLEISKLKLIQKLWSSRYLNNSFRKEG
jgi:hypothetical protein